MRRPSADPGGGGDFPFQILNFPEKNFIFEKKTVWHEATEATILFGFKNPVF